MLLALDLEGPGLEPEEIGALQGRVAKPAGLLPVVDRLGPVSCLHGGEALERLGLVGAGVLGQGLKQHFLVLLGVALAKRRQRVPVEIPLAPAGLRQPRGQVLALGAPDRLQHARLQGLVDLENGREQQVRVFLAGQAPGHLAQRVVRQGGVELLGERFEPGDGQPAEALPDVRAGRVQDLGRTLPGLVVAQAAVEAGHGVGRGQVAGQRHGQGAGLVGLLPGRDQAYVAPVVDVHAAGKRPGLVDDELVPQEEGRTKAHVRKVRGHLVPVEPQPARQVLAEGAALGGDRGHDARPVMPVAARVLFRFQTHDARDGVAAPGTEMLEPRGLEQQEALVAHELETQAVDDVVQFRRDVAPALGRVAAQGVAQGPDDPHPGQPRVVGQAGVGLEALEMHPGQPRGRLDRRARQARIAGQLGLEVGMEQDLQGIRRNGMLPGQFHGNGQGAVEFGTDEQRGREDLDEDRQRVDAAPDMDAGQGAQPLVAEKVPQRLPRGLGHAEAAVVLEHGVEGRVELPLPGHPHADARVHHPGGTHMGQFLE